MRRAIKSNLYHSSAGSPIKLKRTDRRFQPKNDGLPRRIVLTWRCFWSGKSESLVLIGRHFCNNNPIDQAR